MKSSARIFFAGVGTTFVILGVGFGGGLFMANSALKEPTGYQAKAKAELPTPARVILPTTAEAASPPQAPQQVATVEPAPAPSPEPVLAPEKRVERVDIRKAEMEVRERRERRKRYAERKTRREAYRVKQLEPRERQEPRILAFDGDEPRQTAGFSFFGNN